MRKRTAALALLFVAATAASCGSRSEGGSASSSVPPTSNAPSTTTTVDPLDRYTSITAAMELEPTGLDEVESVAANVCDNTLADMTGLVGIAEMMEDTTGENWISTINEKAVVIEVWCPSQRVVLEQAVKATTSVPVLISVDDLRAAG